MDVEAGRPAAGCPKRMVHGPCGGVRADLSCELGDRPCPFATAPPVSARIARLIAGGHLRPTLVHAVVG